MSLRKLARVRQPGVAQTVSNQSGLSLLQGLFVLAVIGVVATIIASHYA